LGISKRFFAEITGKKIILLKQSFCLFFSQGKGRSLGVTPVTTFFYETRGFIFVFKNELKS